MGELRRFGLAVGGIFAALAALFLWRARPTAFWTCLVPAAPLLVLGVVRPRLLASAYRAWMALGHGLGRVTTPLLLGALYYTGFTLMRFYLTLRRRDPMQRRPDPARDTYWRDVPERTVEPEAYEHPF